jgi:prepilin-type N-terminal cleavage/methylation domain-containing protein
MFSDITARFVRRARTAAAAGFTLVEILAVVVILGIASAIIIPQIGTRDDMRAAAAARTIIADLIYAQNLAISTGQTIWVRFDVAGNKYTVITDPSSAKAKFGDPVRHPLTDSDYAQAFGNVSSGTDPWEQVKISAAPMNGEDSAFQGEFTVGFDSIGMPYVWCYDVNQSNPLLNGSVKVQAGSTTAFDKTVTISAQTGEIRVSP